MKKKKLIFILSFILLTFCSLSLFADWDFVAGGYISEIQFIGDDGWAVVSEGLVMHTQDGGATWEYQETDTTERLYDVSFVSNVEGWVTGNDGLIFHTTDGGNIWTSQNSTTTTNMQSIIFVDALNGWAAGSYGEIIHTSDGGMTWAAQTSGISSKIYSIFFIDALNGWAVSASDYIIHTVDGGVTWAAQTNPTTDSMKDVIFYDVNEGWATGSNTIIHTIDGGENWINQANPADENLYGIGMGDNNHLWVVGIDGEILATTDGGTTWVEQSFALDWLLGTHFINDLTGWIVGSGGAIYKTTDGGSNWIAQRDGTSAGLRRTVFVDENNVWGCGTKGFIIHSDDGGLTWEGKDSGFDDWIWDITFAPDLLHGWAAGDDQAGQTPILATVDGGETWTQQLTGIYEDVIGIKAVSTTEVFAAAKDGYILHTTDGGTTWNQQTSGVTVDFKSIEMISEDIGWVVGVGGTILYTDNGGTTWIQQTSGTTETIYDISFVDSQNGWAAGNSGTMLNTSDGGVTWAQQPVGTTDGFNRVSAISLNEVWAIADEGFHTTDGGLTWNSVPIPCTIGLWGLDFANSNLGIAMGNGGIIARYTSAILNPPQNLFVDETGYATWDAPLTRDFLGYNIYLDGFFVDFTTNLFWQYTDLINGQTYTGGVTALYDEGETPLTEFEFTYIIETFDPPENVQVDPYTGTVTWEAPVMPNYWLDDMDSYVAGEYLALQSDDWTTWSGNPGGADDGYVVDELAFSGSNSLKVEGSTTDLVHEFGAYTSGVYEVSMMIYIEPGHGGYYNLLHFFNGASSEWGMEVFFGSDGTGDLCATAQNITTFSHPVGSWFEVMCIIDLDADWAEYYVDDIFVYEWQWSIDTVGVPGSCEFGAIDIFAYAPVGDTPMFYCDNIMLNEIISRDLIGYNVYLDDMVNPVATVGIDVFEFTYEDLVNGQEYVAGVSAVYDEEESIIIEYLFEYGGEDAGNVIVAVTKLNDNYPNPFNPTTTISFSIKEAGHVSISIYNMRGQLVYTLVNDVRETGNYTVTWNGKDNTNKAVASGVYFYKMKAQTYNSTKKMILMK